MLVSLLAAMLLIAPQTEERVILGTDVVCRDRPDGASAIVGSLSVSDAVQVDDRSEEADGAQWLLVGSRSFRRPCWVSAELTTPLDRTRPDVALLVLADHFLTTRRGRPFADFIELHNLFIPWNPSWARNADVSGSPILSLRRAELVDAALATVTRRSLEADPLARSFILSQGQTVRYFEPGGLWHVARSYYLDLHRRFIDSPAAEELLWAAARQPRYHDCEGNSDCWLGGPLESVALYWAEYPDGRFVDEAIAIALDQLGSLPHCDSATSAPPSPERLDDLRSTLADVPDPRKASLLDHLDRIEAGCP